MKTTGLTLLFFSATLFFISCNNSSQSTSGIDQEEQMDSDSVRASLIWKTDTVFTGSESALYDLENNTIYVSCGNNGSEKDGDGFIAVINPDGSVKNLNWTTGLNAPKGMAILGSHLYVTDIDEIVQIDISSGKILHKYPVEGAEALNDMTTDGSVLYFSDRLQNKAYQMDTNGEYELIAENVPNINGMEYYKGTLYGLNGEGLIRFDKAGGYEVINAEVKGGDGLVALDDDTFIASRWAGEIYFIDGDKVTKIVDTTPEKSNTADIGYIPSDKLIIVPTFLKNGVAAYRLHTGAMK